MTDQKIIPNEGQAEGIDKIQKFLKSSERIFLLTGKAGTGKTTIIKLALQGYDMVSEYPEVVGITLTHKAKKVLRKSIPTSTTFADAFSYREHIDDRGRRTFKPKKDSDEPALGKQNISVFVHDEISMYTYEMLRIMLNEHPIFSKIIIMGDPGQLPPIGEDMKPDEDSPLFKLDLPEHCKHHLTERVRQTLGNPILDLSDLIYEEIFGSQNLNRTIEEILKPKLNNEGKGYLVQNKTESIIDYHASGNFENEKIIGFRNEKFVYPVNKKVRDLIFPNESRSLVKGDYVFMTNNYRYKSFDLSFKIENAEEFYIDDIDVVDRTFKFIDSSVECYRCYRKEDNKFFFTPTEKGMQDYKEILSSLEQQAKVNRMWKDFYAFKDAFADYTMGYAINAYRCQGSTYKNVYIDVADILSVYFLTNKRKLQTLYTAVTRATDKVIFMR